MKDKIRSGRAEETKEGAGLKKLLDYASELRCTEMIFCINQMVLPSTVPPSSPLLPSILFTNETVWVFVTVLDHIYKQLLMTEATE